MIASKVIKIWISQAGVCKQCLPLTSIEMVEAEGPLGGGLFLKGALYPLCLP